MLVRAKWVMFLDSLVAANQKLLALLNQDSSRNGLLDPGNVTELSAKLLVLLMS